MENCLYKYKIFLNTCICFQSLDLGDIGAIQKIRVCAGYEMDPNTVWTINKVSLMNIVDAYNYHSFEINESF